MLLRSVLSFNSEKNTWQVRRERRELGVDMMNKGYFVTISYGKIVPMTYFSMSFLALCSIWEVDLFKNLIKKVSPFNSKMPNLSGRIWKHYCLTLLFSCPGCPSKRNWAWMFWKKQVFMELTYTKNIKGARCPFRIPFRGIPRNCTRIVLELYGITGLAIARK